ncbi:hypothetical protein COV93_06825 [Candidatus Woesearchaeota archaeon CG11_big_fil_rev_8_21_14_0_20_43_8]|nr:MAG: hypothetical protein COV93_06825 [Candidatus Woesearchaeota archaeon CG11_big_fil_rev_8_21_14_0_20_43_8]PIO05191.1 MAG: hypothetical protein COT47_05755 [Candidatus Woesearchaeota archaeon CG08_land_8_20_14_0_20_43_7]
MAIDIKKILMHKKTGRKFYVRDTSVDFHSQFGFVCSTELEKKAGNIVQSNTKDEFIILEPNFLDIYSKIKRAPQIIPLKDIGLIITRCGITKESVVVDAGAGSGALAISLGAIAKKVYTFEKREDHLAVAKKNIEFMGFSNIVAEQHDIYESVPVDDADTMTLDVPEPWLALDSAEKCLKVGGMLVSYSPCIPQVSDFVEAVKIRDKFQFIETIELTERQWEIEGRKVRPKSRSINHSGFLSFVRKIK